MEYSQYLFTSHWQKKRSEKLALRPFCQICNSSEKLNIHHKKYRDKKTNQSILFNERVTDLITLCSSCHRFIHHYFGIEVLKINKKILRVRRLMELGVTKKMAFQIVSNPTIYEALYKGILQNKKV
ncbi:MAG: hypothetical protein KGI08_03410 [Thaumarchaeota archaeon]|nr:hypothetical protein [Nitrososphaerota archaeon]